MSTQQPDNIGFTSTVSVGGVAAGNLQEAFQTQQKILSTLGQLYAKLAKLAPEMYRVLAQATQKDVEAQARTASLKAISEIVGAGVSFGISGLCDLKGISDGAKKGVAATGAERCEEMTTLLKKGATEVNFSDNLPEQSTTTSTRVPKDDIENLLKKSSADRHKAGFIYRTLEKGDKQVTSIGNLSKSEYEKLRNNAARIENAITPLEEGKKTIRETEADKFAAKAVELRKLEATYKDRSLAATQHAQLYGQMTNGFVTGIINNELGVPSMEAQAKTAAAKSIAEGMAQMPSQLQSATQSEIQNAEKNLDQKVSTLAQTQTSRG